MLVYHVHFNDMIITDKLNDEMHVVTGWRKFVYIDRIG
jgi:hypothetical protein